MPGFYSTIARYYDAEHTDKIDDLLFYDELAGEYGDPILEIGCGTGRVMFHLGQAGYTVHGIDNEASMLERAHRRLDSLPHLKNQLTLHQGDVFTYSLEGKYKLTLLTYNALMHFHEQEAQLALLKRMRQWTADDGLLVIDLPNAGETFASQDNDAITLERTFIEPENGHLVMQQAVSYLDRVEQLMRVTWIYDEVTGDGVVKRTVAPVVFRYFFYPEVQLLLKSSGFEVVEVYGDTERGPFEDGCERMIILAKPVNW
ncbi:MAG: class I SAM-dependent methyltransferase [Anaerolineaceae bacterium]|nr:class I SAM-dependent methyltransferase [Anaerolineaceae bacterium]